MRSLVWSSRIQTTTRKSKRFPYLVGTVISRIQTTPMKSKQFPYLVGMIVHVTKDKQFINAPYLIGTVVHVAKNNECILLACHIWFVSWRIMTELSLLTLHI